MPPPAKLAREIAAGFTPVGKPLRRSVKKSFSEIPNALTRLPRKSSWPGSRFRKDRGVSAFLMPSRISPDVRGRAMRVERVKGLVGGSCVRGGATGWLMAGGPTNCVGGWPISGAGVGINGWATGCVRGGPIG